MRITRVEIDDENLEHVTRHGVAVAEIEQVLFAGCTIRCNRKGRTATHVAVGETGGGSGVIIPFVIVGEGVVRPVAAWRRGG